MAKKWKILGYQANFGWYDIKTKLKHLIRSLFYTEAFQALICLIFISYMRLVFFSSKKVFVNQKVLESLAKGSDPLFFALWHNRLMLAPFFVSMINSANKNRQKFALASRHGDGQFISKIMAKFGAEPILGSTRDSRKASRGIDITNFRKIFTSLKKSGVIAITPDGPRGPSQKINGELLNIARISGAGIFPISYAASRFRRLKTWDNFLVPLPFSKICFVCDEQAIYVPKDASESEIFELTKKVEERMNFAQDLAEKIVTQSRK